MHSIAKILCSLFHHAMGFFPIMIANPLRTVGLCRYLNTSVNIKMFFFSFTMYNTHDYGIYSWPVIFSITGKCGMVWTLQKNVVASIANMEYLLPGMKAGYSQCVDLCRSSVFVIKLPVLHHVRRVLWQGQSQPLLAVQGHHSRTRHTQLRILKMNCLLISLKAQS